MDIAKSQSQIAEQHDQFFKRLEGAQNRFGIIADYFSQGVFNKVTIVSENRAVGTVQGSYA